jgi:hypothetical protein
MDECGFAVDNYHALLANLKPQKALAMLVTPL